MKPLVRMSVLLYRIAMWRYPRQVRRAYGDDMLRDLERLLREAADARGMAGLGAAWVRIAKDLLRPLPHVRVPPVMGPGPARRSTLLFDAARQDLAFAARSLGREPRFTGLVVAVLGVGIAACVSVFAVVNAYLLRPLPFPHSDRLVGVQGAFGAVTWQEVGDVFERAVSWDLDVFILVGDGRAEMTRGAWITRDFLDTYAVGTALGRTFSPEEASAGGASVALISHRLWQQRFGGDAEVLGRTFRAYTSDRPDHAEVFTIVGVLERDFWYFNDYTDVLVPIRDDRAVYTGRLRPDVSIEQADAYLTEIALARMETVPVDFDIRLVPLQEQHTASVRPTLVVLQGAVLLVLLIACTNGAVLLLVRSGRRERELGVRRALGAARGRLARQLLAEGMLLAGGACALGLGLSWLGLDAVQESVQQRLGRSVPGGASALRIDLVSVGVALGASAVVGLVFGLVPLLTAGRGDLSRVLGSAGRGTTDSRGRRRLRSSMVAAQVGLSLALLTGAGLMIRSALYLQRSDLGFEAARIERGVVGVRAASYPELEDRVSFFERLRVEVGELPQVEDVALTSIAPFTTNFNERDVETDGARGQAVIFTVSEGYFATLGIPLMRGRDFSAADIDGATPVTVLSQSLAAELWPGQEPIGQRVRVVPFSAPGMAPAEPSPWHTVIGTVGDIRRQVGGPEAGDLYASFRQAGPQWMNVVARRRAGAPAVMPAVDGLLQGLDAEVPLASVLELDEALRVALAPSRFTAALLSGFSGFSLMLAVLGLYGVIAYAARQRRRDVAIRMALGADRRTVVSHFLGSGLLVVVAGLILGAAAAVVLARSLEEQLHGVSPLDPLTHLAGALALFIAASVAVWLPARQAARSDPMGVLREE